MLYKQTTTTFLFQSLQSLMQWDELSQFRLVGGTGLSLQLGHRKSVDIDLFTDAEFNIDELAKKIHLKYPEAEIRKLSFGITVYLPFEKSNLKLDIMLTDKFIRDTVVIENIRLAHIEDIAAMKLEAITSRNSKKDYFDIAELLKKYRFEELLSFYEEKYPFNDAKQVLENFTYFSEDCELEYNPIILNNSDWLSVKFLLIDTFNDFIKSKLQ